MYAVGIDIGGTSTKVGRINKAGQILQARQVPTPTETPAALLEALVMLVDDFKGGEGPVGIGLGIPGLRSRDTGVVEFSPNLPCLNGVNLEGSLSEATGLPVVGDNDAAMSAWGEFSLGAGVGSSALACVTLGTGVGAGLVLDGRPYSGHRGYAGEVGHITVDAGGPLCGCGNHGCLETFASARGLVSRAHQKMKTDPTSTLHHLNSPVTAAAIHAAALQGDAVSQETLAEAGRYLGIACAALIHTLDLEFIVIGGGVAAAGELLLKHVRAEAEARSYRQVSKGCQIVSAKLGNNAGIIGAALRALDATG